MKNADQRKLSTDMRLNSDAFRVVHFVASKGAGKHPISNDEFRTLLHMAGPKKVSLALRLAQASNWVARTKGGWGKADFYEFTTPTDPSKTEGTVEPPDPAALVVTEDSLTLPKRKAQDPDPSKMEGTTRAREQRKREGVGGVDIHAHAHEVSPKVGERLKEERWDGFRNSLLDYFRNRVTTERQWGYLMTVQTWFAGGLGAPKGFGKLSITDQRLLVASAVNELLSETATQEKLNYRSSRGMEGSTNVLRAKLEYLIRRNEQPEPKKGSGQGALNLRDPDSLFPEEQE